MPAAAPPSTKRVSSSTSQPSNRREPGDDNEAKPYVVVNHIGKGSFADVYKGYHEVRPLNSNLREICSADQKLWVYYVGYQSHGSYQGC